MESLEEKKELVEEKEEELGGFDLQEDINLQMDFLEIMRSEKMVKSEITRRSEDCGY